MHKYSFKKKNSMFDRLCQQSMLGGDGGTTRYIREGTLFD